MLGVVENESYFICDGCDKRHELFGKGGGQKVAEFADAPLLGQIPIDPTVREWGDAGTPVVQAAPTSAIAKAFVEVTDRLVDRISVHNMSRLGPLTIDRSGGKGALHLPIARSITQPQTPADYPAAPTTAPPPPLPADRYPPPPSHRAAQSAAMPSPRSFARASP